LLEPVNNILASGEALFAMSRSYGNDQINISYLQLTYSVGYGNIIQLPFLPSFVGYLL